MEKEKKNIYQKLFEVKKAGIKLQRDTEGFNYKYATLSQIQEKLSDVFIEQRLLITHGIEENIVVTVIVDVDNPKEYIVASGIPLSEGTKPQDKGSEITYYRRYNLLSLLDLEVEDDDGKKAQDSKPKKYTGKVKQFYNDTEKHIDTWKDLVSDGKTTGKELLAKVTDNGNKLIKKTHREMILALDNK